MSQLDGGCDFSDVLVATEARRSAARVHRAGLAHVLVVVVGRSARAQDTHPVLAALMIRWTLPRFPLRITDAARLAKLLPASRPTSCHRCDRHGDRLGGPEIGKFMDLLLTTRSVRRPRRPRGFIYFVVFLAKPVHKRRLCPRRRLNTRPAAAHSQRTIQHEERNRSSGPRKVVGAPVPRPQAHRSVQTYIPEIAKGLGIHDEAFLSEHEEMAFGQRTIRCWKASKTASTASRTEQNAYPARSRGVTASRA